MRTGIYPVAAMDGKLSRFLCRRRITMAEDGGVAGLKVVRIMEWKALTLGAECVIK